VQEPATEDGEMTFQTKLLLSSSVLAALIVCASQVYMWRLERRLESAIQACKAESTQSIAKAKAAIAANEQGPWTKWQLSEMVCDAETLSRAPNVPGVQKQVADAYHDFSARPDAEAIYLLSGALILLGALPHLWYFALRRLREVAAAIRGQ
jgi:hypothetical protein